MQPNHIIDSQEELLYHFGSSTKLEICDLTQFMNLLALNVPAEVWEDASNKNLLSFSKELVQETKEFSFDTYSTQIEHIYLISFLTNLTELCFIQSQPKDDQNSKYTMIDDQNDYKFNRESSIGMVWNILISMEYM
ncbi:Hypothetical_protein [Hexamita inflata]|uniref:Hypothetical_protein n=1 Tax=Hexamita inflata TaxID=28002 RepID=A0AA86TSA5_9EUKA|nr:Hypothetical protein HINF_LOCUS14684 [Hexamita inflata]